VYFSIIAQTQQPNQSTNQTPVSLGTKHNSSISLTGSPQLISNKHLPKTSLLTRLFDTFIVAIIDDESTA